MTVHPVWDSVFAHCCTWEWLQFMINMSFCSMVVTRNGNEDIQEDVWILCVHDSIHRAEVK